MSRPPRSNKISSAERNGNATTKKLQKSTKEGGGSLDDHLVGISAPCQASNVDDQDFTAMMGSSFKSLGSSSWAGADLETLLLSTPETKPTQTKELPSVDHDLSEQQLNFFNSVDAHHSARSKKPLDGIQTSTPRQEEEEEDVGISTKVASGEDRQLDIRPSRSARCRRNKNTASGLQRSRSLRLASSPTNRQNFTSPSLPCSAGKSSTLKARTQEESLARRDKARHDDDHDRKNSARRGWANLDHGDHDERSVDKIHRPCRRHNLRSRRRSKSNSSEQRGKHEESKRYHQNQNHRRRPKHRHQSKLDSYEDGKDVLSRRPLRKHMSLPAGRVAPPLEISFPTMDGWGPQLSFHSESPTDTATDGSASNRSFCEPMMDSPELQRRWIEEEEPARFILSKAARSSRHLISPLSTREDHFTSAIDSDFQLVNSSDNDKDQAQNYKPLSWRRCSSVRSLLSFRCVFRRKRNASKNDIMAGISKSPPY